MVTKKTTEEVVEEAVAPKAKVEKKATKSTKKVKAPAPVSQEEPPTPVVRRVEKARVTDRRRN